MNSLLGYRKLLLALLAFGTSVGLLLGHVITGDQWVDLNKFLLPAFMAANLIEYFGGSNNSGGSSNAEPHP